RRRGMLWPGLAVTPEYPPPGAEQEHGRAHVAAGELAARFVRPPPRDLFARNPVAARPPDGEVFDEVLRDAERVGRQTDEADATVLVLALGLNQARGRLAARHSPVGPDVQHGMSGAVGASRRRAT